MLLFQGHKQLGGCIVLLALIVKFPPSSSGSCQPLHAIQPFIVHSFWPMMVLIHSFYLVGAVSLVHGVVAQDFPGFQPLSRLANGFIVEYADDPQTHSVVSFRFLSSIM